MTVLEREQVAEQHAWCPPPLLRHAVDHYTGYRYAGFEPGRHMGLPSRHLTFIISFDQPLDLTMVVDGRRTSSTFDAVVSGFHTAPAVIRHDGSQHGIQLHVTPPGARRLFDVPAGDLASDAVPLDALWGPLAAELRDRLDAAPTWRDRFTVLDAMLLRVVASRPLGAPTARAEATEAFRRLIVTDGLIDISSLADHVGWSRRHLSGEFAAEYGVSPKQMARVLRFDRSRSRLVAPDAGSMASIAAECGYADQAHMAREWRALAGASPSQWLAAERLPLVVEEWPEEPASASR